MVPATPGLADWMGRGVKQLSVAGRLARYLYHYFFLFEKLYKIYVHVRVFNNRERASFVFAKNHTQ